MSKNKIANKLFGGIILALVGLLGLQIVFQTLYLQQYYTQAKRSKMTKSLSELGEQIKSATTSERSKVLLKYSEEMGAATAVTDLYGMPLYGLNTQRAFVEMMDAQGQIYRVYIDGFVSDEEAIKIFCKDQVIEVSGFLNWAQDVKEIYPNKIMTEDGIVIYESALSSSIVIRSSDAEQQIVNKTMNVSRLTETAKPHVGGDALSQNIEGIKGEIVEVYRPSKSTSGNSYREVILMQELNRFLAEMRQGQGQLYVDEPIIYERVDEYVGINNMIGIVPIILEDSPVLLITMISLQGVQEAAQIMMQYTLIIFGMGLGVALIGAYWYAKKLTSPLVELRNITTHIANLDFSKSCNVERQDELGELANNINIMSTRLKENIENMRSDLALKEQLEVQRKQLIADVSHELKTPLTVMKGTCCGIIDGIYDRSDSAYFETMLRQINQMSELVQELLEVSRMENEVSLNQEVFVLSDLVFKVHRELKPLLNEKALQVSLELEEYMVKGDRKKIETVIRNLYNNAIFYTPNGHEIKINNTMAQQKVYLEITNTGVSIPEGHIERIWEPFYRIDHSRNKALGGSGLGLYMIKQILDKHGSLYGVKSEEHEVTFWFELTSIEEG
ncbi:MAG: sensor histidine kinase [Cellulosilyticaceae bacterium]